MLRFLAEPTHVTFGGKVHGGIVTRWIDQTGYACAVRWSDSYCVSIYVGGIRFHKPVPIGHVVEERAKLIHMGRISMHIAVDVATRHPKDGRYTRITNCIIVSVAVDDTGAPVEVERLQSRTEQDKALERYAKKISQLRKAVENDEARLCGMPNLDSQRA